MLLLAFVVLVLLGGRLANRDWIVGIGWAVFGLYWLAQLPHYVFEVQSFVESALVLAGVPACVYIGVLAKRGVRVTRVITDATLVAGGLFFLATTAFMERFLIETVASQTVAIIQALGYEASLVVGPNGYESEIVFSTYSTYITLGCTGVGAISVFAGVFAAVKAPVKKRLAGVAITTGTIYLLNMGRNVFVALAYGNQWFRSSQVASLLGYTEPGMSSFYIAHTVVSQSLAVVALLGILFVSIRVVPELRETLIELLEQIPDPAQIKNNIAEYR